MGRETPDVRAVGEAMADAVRLLPAPPADTSRQPPARRIRTGSDTVEEDLVKLVLTVVELLRQLIERQALRRVDAGGLTEGQEEELGATLLALHDRMTELCAQHGFTLDDLNLDLGPLGPLLPPPEA
ncbi:gas vesicle protein K [Streptomyces litmocidini]|uniref:Gas vesicle protein K n=1 Tax=Streptomyces litmocidini TaxID=67318 RepID=A0ABW7U0V6_9ACTN|nr:gas vesicle protein K [Streptomyces sp. PanSC19]ROQ36445.1 gas vesicle protein GvpK [Streptomyces sp. PanSC19]